MSHLTVFRAATAFASSHSSLARRQEGSPSFILFDFVKGEIAPSPQEFPPALGLNTPPPPPPSLACISFPHRGLPSQGVHHTDGPDVGSNTEYGGGDVWGICFQEKIASRVWKSFA